MFTCTTEVVRTVIELNRATIFADSGTLVKFIKVHVLFTFVMIIFSSIFIVSIQFLESSIYVFSPTRVTIDVSTSKLLAIVFDLQCFLCYLGDWLRAEIIIISSR